MKCSCLVIFLGITFGNAPTTSSLGYAKTMALFSYVRNATSGESDTKNSIPTVPWNNMESDSGRKMLLEFLSSIQHISPLHHFYLMYDNSMMEVANTLIASLKSGLERTVLKITEDMVPLYDILTPPLTDTNVARRHVWILCSLANLSELFSLVSARNLENPDIWWIVIIADIKAMQILQGLLREGSQVTVMKFVDHSKVQVFVSRVEQDNVIRFQECATWMSSYKRASRPTSRSGDLRVKLLAPALFQPLEMVYSDFKGRQLTVTANDNSPFFGMKWDSTSGQYVPDSGIDISIMDALSSKLNFTYRVKKPSDGKWGGPLPDGNVTGMIGEVYRRNAHLAICEITITGLRESVIDFTYPYYLESLTLISRAPAERNRAFAVFSPFTFEVWICIVGAVLAVGPLLSAETWFMKKTYLKKEMLEKYSLNRFSFNTFRNLVVQTNLLSVQYWPHRFVFIFWYLFCFYISVLYSGILTAVLVTPAFDKPVDHLTDLPKAVKEGFTLGIIGDTSFEELFKAAKEGIYQETWELFNHKDRSKSFLKHPDEGFDKILEEKFIFVNPQLNSKIRATRRGLGKFHFAKQSFYPQGYGIATFSGAPFKRKLNYMLSLMTEGGLITKWADVEVAKVAGKSHPEDTNRLGPTAITLKHLQFCPSTRTTNLRIKAVSFVQALVPQT
ncbi:hypothetical protein SK128_018156 [Halocaridina rubra]|uniref:Uncharacterized protein n=1 Tax=Halocaridina rubra TaxID=373956 RepID=A0AAN9A9D7_HALRR